MTLQCVFNVIPLEILALAILQFQLQKLRGILSGEYFKYNEVFAIEIAKLIKLKSLLTVSVAQWQPKMKRWIIASI